MTQSWSEFLVRSRPSVDWQEAGALLCLDPGETTGWAIFEHGELTNWGQEATDQDPALMADFIRSVHFDIFGQSLNHLLYEEYRIRGNKAQQHIGSEVVTIQHIGVIRAVAAELDIPIYKQGAGLAKGFATDTKLRRWGLFQTNQRHANDAIRHGVYWLLFNYGRQDPRDRRGSA